MSEIMEQYVTRDELRAELAEFKMEIKDMFRTQMEAIDQRFEKLDQRFEKIDQQFQAVGDRMYTMDARITDLDRHLNVVTWRFIGFVAAIGTAAVAIQRYLPAPSL